jgi:Zn-dependent protease/CBS domain-containing protein
MSWSIPLLRVRGIAIKVHVTFVLILVWAAYYWGIETGAGLQGALFGIVATLLLFVCVTLHELGHAFQALKYGIAVEDITLLPIGGVARLQVPDNARQELAIAVAGPAVNVAIAAVLIVIGALTGTTVVEDPTAVSTAMGRANWAALLPYLTVANIGLVLFNAIPAFPLDGGRVLRALLALRLDYARATAIAVAIGQGLALLLGLVGFLGGNYFLIVIAIFIWFGASQEGEQVALRRMLGGATVGQAMIQRPQVLAAAEPIGRAVELTLSTAQADFPVVDAGGRVVGLLTLDDLLRGLRDQPAATVGEAMRRQFPVARPEESVAVAQGQLSEGRVRALPVVQSDGQLAGLLTAADIGEALRLIAARPQVGAIGAGGAPAMEQGPVLDGVLIARP